MRREYIVRRIRARGKYTECNRYKKKRKFKLRSVSTPLLLAIFFVAATLCSRPRVKPGPVQANWRQACANNAESQLSCLNRISLRQASLGDLLLIAGVGDKTAATLYNERAQILASAHANGEAEGLETAKGVGPATAKKLLPYLSLK